MNRRDEMELPYKDCPTCGLHWHLFAPAKIDGKEAVRCVECKAVYPLSSQAEPGYVVKPLEWPDQCERGRRVHCAPLLDGIEQYCISHSGGDIGPTVYRWARQYNSWSHAFDTYEAAKAAAQADYECRIRSAITTVGTAEPGYVAGPTCHCHDDTARKFCLDKDRCTQMAEAQAALPAPASPQMRILTEEEDNLLRQALIDSGTTIEEVLPAPATASAGEEVTVEELEQCLFGMWDDLSTTFKDDAQALLSTYKITKRIAT